MSNEKTQYSAMVYRALAVQEVYQSHKKEGVTDVHIYRAFILPQFGISQRTYQRYLGVNAKRFITKLENANHDQSHP